LPIVDITNDPKATPKALIVGYGHSGTSKTSWGTAYPDSWGKGLYFGLDPDAWRMDSILEKYKGRLYNMRFEGGDPITNMSSIVTDDWSKDYPDAGVVIIDTLSAAARAMLQDAANKAYFKGDKGDMHIRFGPKDAKITQAIPGVYDYMGGKFLVENWLNLLIENVASKYHVIVLCHEDYDQPRKSDEPDPSVTAVGGPATFGRKLLTVLPTYFPTVLRFVVSHRTDLTGKTISKYQVVSSMQGDYIARIRENNPDGNPMPIRDLARDARPWWDEYESKFMKGAK
jgi:hypothetical protein